MTVPNPERDAGIIVVIGATGQQGGAVARALAADGRWQVRAVVRNPASPAATRLSGHGIEVVPGDLDRPESLSAAFAGANGVYAMQPANGGPETELRQGAAVVDAASAAGVGHFIYASVGGAERQSGVPHFESKWAVEQYLARSGLPATVVRPSFFMDNFARLPMRIVLMALLRRYVPRDKPLQMIATEDIGAWVVRAFAEPAAFIGRAQEIAGDELTHGQVVAAFKACGWFPGLPFALPHVLLRRVPGDVLKMIEWFATDGYRADIPRLRADQPGLLTLEQWLRRQQSERNHDDQ
ncbi:hypothetical protein DNJ95_10625 [Stutzerimonas kirkiae]|uniref:NmrA-like domain-containing protein n=1 Tax=Stutzerimonas kirkiae TaxID=2211392 RepID=A0A4Q9RBR0_9GAMM|nr:NmrA/HSCARG family protein [Stutzerimonas kirkiae]TBU98352.1 hypothetical protein DNJ96_06105 [Stutzerimonas kirkiae]TBV01987.1 hypothetical protein DNJ95_10625 [Stutzerimonas kirkiae]